MEEIQPGIYEREDKIYTLTRSDQKVYGENFVDSDNEKFREWNPNRSKAGAAVKKEIDLDIERDSDILYLGAASGTTVSHLSDIVEDGIIYAVEYSDTVFRDLLSLAEDRDNIAPFLDNARNPENYRDLVSKSDVVFQDISQQDQAEIFIKNCRKFLKPDGVGLLAVKARSISTSEDKEVIFEDVKSKIREEFEIIGETELEPFESEHLFLKLKKKN